MIRKFTLLVLGLVLSLSLKAQDWRDELLAQNVGVIDSVVLLRDHGTYNSYMVYYNQPLQHDAPETGTFPLRAILILNTDKDIFNNMVQMTIGGYQLEANIVNYPNVWAELASFKTSMGELAAKYNGNFLLPEHRFYGKSRPENYTTLISYCNAKEAAADFHALAEAMKKVFKGKWAITGVSKGGVATTIQHAFYPEDADLFVPYVSRSLTSLNDLRPQEYWLTKAWTPELREQALHIQKEILNRPKVMEHYFNFKGWSYSEGYDLENVCQFLYETICTLDETSHQSVNRSEIEEIFHDNQNYLKKEGLTDYTDEMLAYMALGGSYFINEDYKDMEEYLLSLNNSQSTRAQQMPDVLTEDDIYSYQNQTELGFFDFKWDYYYETQAQADSVNNLWKSYRSCLNLLNAPEAFQSLEYDPSLMNFVRQQTAQTKKPILFIYGEDDPWTGGGIDDEYVNGTNVRKYILPAQCHSACIYDIKDSDSALKEELFGFIESALFPSPDGISEVNDEPTAAPAGIVFDQQNHRIVIRRNGQEYDVMGKKVF